MMKKAFMHLWKVDLGLCLVAGFLISCLGGTGTETENQVQVFAPFPTQKEFTLQMVDQNNKPLALTKVSIQNEGYIPDSSADLLSTSNRKTDKSGNLQMAFSFAGSYVIEAYDSTGVILFDTLHVTGSGPKINSRIFKAQDFAEFKGKISLQSSLIMDSAALFIRGTKHRVNMDKKGNYNFGRMPLGVSKMGIGANYFASQVARKELRVKIVSTIIPADTTKIDTTSTQPTVKLDTTYSCSELHNDTLMVDSANQNVPLDSVRKSEDIYSTKAIKICSLVPGSVVQVSSNTSEKLAAQYQVINVNDQIKTNFIDTLKSISSSCIKSSTEKENQAFDLKLESNTTGTQIVIQDIYKDPVCTP